MLSTLWHLFSLSFCLNERYYRVGGWKSHKSAKHAQVVWFGAPEATQAYLMLSAMQEEVTTPNLVPTPVTADDDPPEDTLPFVPDVD